MKDGLFKVIGFVAGCGVLSLTSDVLAQSNGSTNRIFASSFEVAGGIDPLDVVALDGVYPPMSAQRTQRYEYMKTQYLDWYRRQAPDNNGGDRGSGEAWRYDPMKTLIEFCRRAALVGDSIPGLCDDAKDTLDEFFERQHWGSSGAYPDCSGGIEGIPRGGGTANKCDFKYGGHGSALHYARSVYGENPYTAQQEQLMKQFCYTQGWAYGWDELDSLDEGFTERFGGISLQCLIDLQKAGVDTSSERDEVLGILHRSFNFQIEGQAVGAPMHGLSGHECSNYCSGPEWDLWMFSPWMGAAFLMPALWEHWVFLEKDPRIAEMIVKYGDAMLRYGVVDPDLWAPGEGPWRISSNPTPWVTLYISTPYSKSDNVRIQNSEGWFSDQHNPESVFVFNLAYFFSCDQRFRERSESMNGYFNQTTAADDPGSVNRVFLWQHRGSASTEWLLENARCRN